MQDNINQYIVKSVGGQRRIVGVLVGQIRNNMVKIGWSRANINAGDRFNKAYGLHLAYERANASEMPFAPHSFAEDIFRFSDRCRRYFKGYDVQEIRICNRKN